MRFEIGRESKIRLVRRDQRETAPISEIEQRRLDGPLLRQAMPLQFDVEALAKKSGQRIEPHPCWFGPVVVQEPVDCPIRAAGQTEEIVAARRELRQRHARAETLRRREVGERGEAHQIAVALL